MTLGVTLIVLLISLAAFVLAAAQGRRPVEQRRARWIPYTGLQFLALVAAILMLAHLISLLTGEPLKGRMLG